MAALSKKNFRLWGYGKVFVLFAGCLLFSVSGRLNEGIYFEQHILSAVSDHYYLTCFLLPVLLLSCFSFLEDDGENVILRFQSYHSYFYRKWLGTGGIVLLLIAVQSAAVLLSGMGLPGEMGGNYPKERRVQSCFLCCGSIFPPRSRHLRHSLPVSFSEAG